MSAEPIDAAQLQGQLGGIISNLLGTGTSMDMGSLYPVDSNGGVTMTMPMSFPQSITDMVPAPRNYEPEHMRKLSVAQLFKLEGLLTSSVQTQAGISARHTQVCIVRTQNAINEKV